MVAVIVAGLTEILEPFLQPNSEPFALALLADKMTDDEQQHFPQYAKYVLAFILFIGPLISVFNSKMKHAVVKLCLFALCAKSKVK